jgi:Lipocalin-like domain
MKNFIGFVLVSLFFVSCQQEIKPEDIAKITGYWEIEKVVFEDGEDKNYTVNESYDYFEIGKNNTGFRKKVMPQLDGSFIVNDTQESLEVRFDNDKVFLDYNTPYAKWSEQLIAISDDKMVFENKEKKQYHYKKATPINILGDGKKTK